MENNSKMEPTKSELEILQVLWKHGPSTARFVNDELNKQTRQVNYMSTSKLMQIMVDKKFLAKDESRMKHVYSAVAEEKKTKGNLLEKFVDNLYEGSAGSMAMQLLGNHKISGSELQELKELIAQLEKGKS